jgi:hypothetical protein
MEKGNCLMIAMRRTCLNCKHCNQNLNWCEPEDKYLKLKKEFSK